jgi:diaminohydroxyphosphoribosylaminopyrimidine deaminase / 5-amino-6-(5-phosphoribosylamino)uracil reductase
VGRPINPMLDAELMAMALRLAEKGTYTTQPNPRVGCVIVKDGSVVGRGYHLKAGEAHAEAHALEEAGIRARGATVYCTLEPCSFHGRTPSCAEALVAAGVSRVVAAMQDPHPKNRGKGFDMLRRGGIAVDESLLESSARLLNPGHIKRFEHGMPYVRLKLAMSLDGKTALSNGQSQWITGPAARRDVQRLRARSGAIVTGVQTVIDDDPALTVRAAELEVEHATLSASIRRPILVLDPTLRIPATAALLRDPNTVLVCLNDTDRALPAQTLAMPSDGHGRIDLAALLRQLAQMDCHEVLVECGATLAAAFVGQRLVDEIVLYAAPVMLGADARSLLRLANIDSMRDRIEMRVVDVRHIGDDIRITCIPK